MNASMKEKERKTFIYRIDPITKLLFTFVAVYVVYVLPSFMMSTVVLSVCCLLLWGGGVLRKVIPLISVSGLILVSIVIIQSLFYGGNEHVLLQLGAIRFYREGFLYAVSICLKIFVIICAFAVVILTTPPTQMVESLTRRGLSPKIGYVLLSVLQLIPQISATTHTITDAQRSRGMKTEGSLRVRIKAFFPLIGPVVMSSLTNTRERSMALEVRAFDSKRKRTYLNEEIHYPFSRFVRIGLWLIFIASNCWRVVTWLK